MNSFWSWVIASVVIINIAGIMWLLFATAKTETSEEETTGHEWDGIQELNTPLPRWWLNLFVLTTVFGLIYLVLYPGLVVSEGVLGWSQIGAYDTANQQSQDRFEQTLARYKGQSIEQLSTNDEAMATAKRLFGNHCSTCHGSDGGGALGFPNLTDQDWLYGGKASDIQLSIRNGRSGAMPPMALALKTDGNVFRVAKYVLSLSTPQKNAKVIAEGKALFAQQCSMCHGAGGEGNQLLGAPNLTDNIWLYGGDIETIMAGIREGRSGNMPAHEDILSATEINLLAAYVHSISHRTKQ